MGDVGSGLIVKDVVICISALEEMKGVFGGKGGFETTCYILLCRWSLFRLFHGESLGRSLVTAGNNAGTLYLMLRPGTSRIIHC